MPVVHSDAGHLPAPDKLENIPALMSAYYTEFPNPVVASQRVAFGTSGHRGSSVLCSFNEEHIYAITQAVCDYRAAKGIDGPLFLGGDTHGVKSLERKALWARPQRFSSSKVYIIIIMGHLKCPVMG